MFEVCVKSIIKTGENKQMLFISKDFVHRFLALANETKYAYKITDEYSPVKDKNIKWNDPAINVDWKMKSSIPLEKDRTQPFLDYSDINFEYY